MYFLLVDDTSAHFDRGEVHRSGSTSVVFKIKAHRGRAFMTPDAGSTVYSNGAGRPKGRLCHYGKHETAASVVVCRLTFRREREGEGKEENG